MQGGSRGATYRAAGNLGVRAQGNRREIPGELSAGGRCGRKGAELTRGPGASERGGARATRVRGERLTCRAQLAETERVSGRRAGASCVGRGRWQAGPSECGVSRPCATRDWAVGRGCAGGPGRGGLVGLGRLGLLSWAGGFGLLGWVLGSFPFLFPILLLSKSNSNKV